MSLSVLLIFACSKDDDANEQEEQNQAQTIVLTLDNIDVNTATNDVWTEESLDLSFVNTTDDDCVAGSSSFGIETTFVWLYPSRLKVDLQGLQNIERVEVVVNDFCSEGCTQAFLIGSSGTIISNAANTQISAQETLVVENPSGGAVNELAISSCEGQVLEITIYRS